MLLPLTLMMLLLLLLMLPLVASLSATIHRQERARGSPSVTCLESIVDANRRDAADGGRRLQLLLSKLSNDRDNLVRVQWSLSLSPLVAILNDQRLDLRVILAHLFKLFSDLELDLRVLEGSLGLDVPLVAVLLDLDLRLR